MALIRNPDGTTRRAGGSIAAPNLYGGGGTGDYGSAPRPAPAPQAPAAAYGGRPVSSAYQQWQQQENRDHILNGAYTPQEKASKLGENIIGPNGVTFQPGKTTAISTLANGRGGGYGYGGGVGIGAGGIGGGGRGVYGGIPGGTLGVGIGLQDAQDEANRKTEERFNKATGIADQSKADQLSALQSGYGNVYGTINSGKGEQMDFLNKNLADEQALTSNFGSTAHERENRRLAGQKSNAVQSLVGRGLSNSTVQDSLLKGYDTDSAFIQNGIDEDTARLRVGLQQDYGHSGLDVLGRSSSALAGAQLGEANATPDVINRTDAQRIRLQESRIDEGPDYNAYLHQLNQAGAMGGGPGGYGSGAANGRPRGFNFRRPNGGDQDTGGGFDPVAFMQQYLASQGYGGGQQSQGFQPDPRTVAANQRVRQQEAERLARYRYGQGGSFGGSGADFF